MAKVLTKMRQVRMSQSLSDQIDRIAGIHNTTASKATRALLWVALKHGAPKVEEALKNLDYLDVRG